MSRSTRPKLFRRNGVHLDDLRWDYTQLNEAVDILAQRSRFIPESVSLPAPPPVDFDPDMLEDWMNVVAGQMKLELEQVEATYADVDKMVQQSAPAILYFPSSESPRIPQFLVMIRSGRRHVDVLARDLSIKRLDPQRVIDELRAAIEAPYVQVADQILTAAGVPAIRLTNARRAMLAQQLGQSPVRGCWMMRLLPGRPLSQQMRHQRLFRPIVGMFGIYGIQQIISVAGWALIGSMALGGTLEGSTLLAWALLNITSIPFALGSSFLQYRFAVGMGAMFKKRLLYGTLQLNPEEIRHQGMGQFLGRVMEAEAIEQLALSGGLMSMLTIVQILIAVGVLASGAGGIPHAGLLLLWMLITILMSLRFVLRNRRWIIVHRNLTNDLVERMVGHRTRLAQERREHWHDMEDDLMSRYLGASMKNDYASVQLTSTLERGWLVIGMTGIIGAFVAGDATQSAIAVSVGGVLLASQALSSLSNGITSLAGAVNVWDQIAPLFHAAAREKIVSHPTVLAGAFGKSGLNESNGTQNGKNGNGVPVLQIRDMIFRYSQFGRSILDEANLTVHEGDKLLLEGPSGGGKSTLAALITSLRRPDAGVLLLEGFDLQTLGNDEWRRRVVAVPQFHENHVLTETFAFNILMGSQWPPPPELVQEAMEIIKELGLMPLLERMPSGTQQMVGESGWQLSHGERSRLYIARALLQKSRFVVLDESFGALDPETRQMALETVLKRAPTLLVIAHP